MNSARLFHIYADQGDLACTGLQMASIVSLVEMPKLCWFDADVRLVGPAATNFNRAAAPTRIGADTQSVAAMLARQQQFESAVLAAVAMSSGVEPPHGELFADDILDKDTHGWSVIIRAHDVTVVAIATVREEMAMAIVKRFGVGVEILP